MTFSDRCNKYILGKTLDNQYPDVRQYGARYGLYSFFFMNLFNFGDRFLPSSVQPLYAAEFKLNDFQTSLPTLATLLALMLFVMIYGFVSDTNIVDRRILIFSGVFIWSITTSLAFLSTNFTTLIITRIFVGIGEAAYGTVAPPMISDYYPVFERNGAFSIYYLAVPVGVAVAFAIGAVVGSKYGWRFVDLVVTFFT